MQIDPAERDPTKIRISAVQYDQPVGKRLWLSDDGSGVLKEPLLGARSTAGKLVNLTFVTAKQALEYRLNSGPETMFFAGTFDPGIEEAYVVPEQRLERARGARDGQVVAATGEFLNFRKGPGLISIDIDVKSPDEVAGMYPPQGIPPLQSTGEVLDALYELLPEAVGCPILVMPSSSSMIERAKDGTSLKGPGGWRVMLPTTDASQTPRILNLIHERSWALGEHNFAFVSNGGDVLDRSLADQALARPTQPDFPTATLGEGLRKVVGSHLMDNLEADLFDPSSVKLKDDERHAATKNKEVAKRALEPIAKRVKEERKGEEVERLVEGGVPRPNARRIAERKFEKGYLLGSDSVVFAGDESVPVSVLMSSQGEEHDGHVCLDPIEPGYDGGRAVAIFYWNEGEASGVHSFAHGSRFYLMKHDLDSVVAAIREAGSDHAQVVTALARADLAETEVKSAEREASRALALGNSRRELRIEVTRERERLNARLRPFAVDDSTGDPAEGPLPLDQRPPVSSFPQTRTSVQGAVSVIDCRENVGHLTETYGIDVRYNVIAKRLEWDHPAIPMQGDNAENNLHSRLVGLADMNSVPKGHLDLHLTALGETNAYNPVTDYLSGLNWDGAERINEAAEKLNSSDAEIARIALRLFFIQACAAADNGEIARSRNDNIEAHFEYVLVLVGDQGVGKTKGFRRLLPPPLRKYYGEGQVLNVNDKDSVKRVVSFWVVELGELDATFNKSDVSHLKAFTSQSEDRIRAPYARKASNYARRTVFVGTVNEESFLADETGNRRYLPLKVGGVDADWSDDFVEQLWAEAWQLYENGAQWWPTEEEAQLLAANAEKYRIKSEVEERIEKKYAWGTADFEECRRMTASEIYEDAMPHGARRPGPKDLKTTAAAVKIAWRNTGRTESQNGVLMLRKSDGSLVKLNAESGKNRGWLMPPKRSDMGLDLAQGAEQAAQIGRARLS
ncbi:virulence-associated E family protein [Actibacterium pelagium]|uniref:Virulence-associated protein E-like domain-containing protein n=1 Tax=Actibacterium pelagium TaxID=2029103 RepID=A0A917EKJ4_9RHOB|nr:virulence-associated E family protein [Actibacterium pelagium]GGE57458.1 hypothetical protein GCM10011517_26570 [Actibacterium pelagium]